MKKPTDKEVEKDVERQLRHAIREQKKQNKEFYDPPELEYICDVKTTGEQTIYTLSHQKLGDQIINNKDIKTTKDNEEMFIRNSYHYQPGAETTIKQLIQRMINGRKKIKTHIVNETIAHIQRETYTPREQFNQYPHLIAVENGVLDIKEEEPDLRDDEEDLYDIILTQKLPIEYDSTADCPRIKQFLKEILYEEDIPVIQEYLGFCLLKNYSYKKSLMFLGEGDNGKSTLLNLIKEFLGPENIASESLQGLQYNRFAKARLYGKLANIYADLDDKALESTGIFKLLTGNDSIDAETKFAQRTIKFTNYAKLMYSANKLPATIDDTDAFMGRWILITFPNNFLEGNPRRNPNILQEITTPQELSGFLNFAIQGLQRLQKNNKFSNSKSTEQLRTEYIQKSNPLQAFTEERLETATPEEYIIKNTLYNACMDWCEEHKLPSPGKTAVGRELQQYIRTTEGLRRPENETTKQRAWIGIKFKNQEQETQNQKNLIETETTIENTTPTTEE